MKIYESIVDDSLKDLFPQQGLNSLMNYTANFSTLPEVLATTSFLWPRLVETNGYVFLAEYPPADNVTKETPDTMRKNESVSNAISLSHFFYRQEWGGQEQDEPYDERLLQALATAVQFFWSLRLKSLFPERDFCVEIGENICGEEGIVITFYQTRYV